MRPMNSSYGWKFRTMQWLFGTLQGKHCRLQLVLAYQLAKTADRFPG